MCVTRLLLRNRLGCRVTSALWNFLICVAVNTQNDSVLGTCRDRGRGGAWISFILHLHLLTNGGSHNIYQSRMRTILPFPHVAVHSVKAPLLHTKGDRVSRGRSVRGGMRAFLLGAEPLERDLSGVHRSEVGGENTEEEGEE